MNHIILRLLIVAFSIAFSLKINAQRAIDQLESQDYVRFESAISLMDNGKAKDAIKIIDGLRKKYENNYFLEYERLYAYSQLKDYKRIVKEGSQLFDHPDADSHCYQLVGNALDYLGNRSDALKTYDEGISRFPNAGNLYLEKGNIHLMSGRYDEALNSYMEGVKMQPDFPSNYYRLAKLYAESTEPLWAVFYGEVVCNLLPGSERCQEMGKLIYDIFNSNIRVVDGNKIQVTMTDESRFVMTSGKTGNQLPVSIIYEIGLLKNPNVVKELQETGKPTIAQIANMRESALELVDSLAHGFPSLSLLEYHRKLIDSGMWTAYNMWLMSPGNPNEVEKWTESGDNGEVLEKFLLWLLQNQFVPTKEKPTLKVFHTNGLSIPDIEELQTSEGCRAYRADVLRLAKWFLDQPANPNDPTQKEVMQFIICWMSSTDEFSFELTTDITPMYEGVFSAFMASMAKHAIEFNKRKTDENMYCEVMKEVINYYKLNKNSLGTINPLEEYLEMDEATLQSTLIQKYKKSLN